MYFKDLHFYSFPCSFGQVLGPNQPPNMSVVCLLCLTDQPAPKSSPKNIENMTQTTEGFLPLFCTVADGQILSS